MIDKESIEIFNYMRKQFGSGKVYLTDDMRLSFTSTNCFLGHIIDFKGKHNPQDFSSNVYLTLNVGVTVGITTHVANIMSCINSYDIEKIGRKCVCKLPNFELGVEYLILGVGDKKVLVYDMENILSLQPASAFGFKKKEEKYDDWRKSFDY